jgi:hypothetical protein
MKSPGGLSFLFRKELCERDWRVMCATLVDWVSRRVLSMSSSLLGRNPAHRGRTAQGAPCGCYQGPTTIQPSKDRSETLALDLDAGITQCQGRRSLHMVRGWLEVVASDIVNRRLAMPSTLMREN